METRGETMLKLRRARMAAAPPILRGGFRPFFMGGRVYGLMATELVEAEVVGGTVTERRRVDLTGPVPRR